MKPLEARCSWDWGLISAVSEEDIPDAVRRHQATTMHREARRRVSLVESNRLARARVRREVAEVRLLRALERERVA